ncbi:hypothetical protein [Vagococcus lutrae]|uniref:hypothetical protein n=1 Tax=Vagococcus lutrae TaxID=81947 RepID=UPI0023AA02EA|nr:hypothetical protein [Vagococcus lutrae]WEB82159.1 hypothetical protein LVJ09_04195 [Vagococcus lutrae]
MKEIWQNSLIVTTSLVIFSLMLYFFTPYIRLEQFQYGEDSVLKKEKIEVNKHLVLTRIQTDDFIYFKQKKRENTPIEQVKLLVIEGNKQAEDWHNLLSTEPKATEQWLVLPLNQWLEPTYANIKRQVMALLECEDVEEVVIYSDKDRYDWLLNPLTKEIQEQNKSWSVKYESSLNTFKPKNLWYHSDLSYLFYWSVNP